LEGKLEWTEIAGVNLAGNEKTGWTLCDWKMKEDIAGLNHFVHFFID